MWYCSTAPADYISVLSEPLTFTREIFNRSVTISIKDDTTDESFESFVASLSVSAAVYAGVSLAPNTAYINIKDNDGKSYFDI